MLTFKEFQKECVHLPLEQQKEAYRWYIKGCEHGCADVCIIGAKAYYGMTKYNLQVAENAKE